MMRLTQNQNNSINVILQYGCVVGKNCCIVFSASGFSFLNLCLRQCNGKVATTYLKGLRTIKIFQYKNLLLLKPPQITRSGIQHCNHWEKRKTIFFLSCISRAFSDMVKYFCVNDGDRKGIAHKFWWEYLMYCFWN